MGYSVKGAAAAAGALALLVAVSDTEACPTIIFSADVEAGTCCETLGPNGQILVSPAFLLRGIVKVRAGNRGVPPLLGNLVVEVQTRNQNRKWVTQRRLVLDAQGNDRVETCQGELAQTGTDGRLLLVDADSRELSFAQAQNLSLGDSFVRFIGTFRGPLPPFEFTPDRKTNKRVRIRAFVTVIGASSSRLCSVDADGDGSIDDRVLTFSKLRHRRIKERGLLVP